MRKTLLAITALVPLAACASTINDAKDAVLGPQMAPVGYPAQLAPQTQGFVDVRQEPPVRRHTLIFEAYEALDPGSAFELVNDHDPKPLYYQFAAEKAGEFSWDYLEQGPEVWRVRIGRVEGGAA